MSWIFKYLTMKMNWEKIFHCEKWSFEPMGMGILCIPQNIWKSPTKHRKDYI